MDSDHDSDSYYFSNGLDIENVGHQEEDSGDSREAKRPIDKDDEVKRWEI